MKSALAVALSLLTLALLWYLFEGRSPAKPVVAVESGDYLQRDWETGGYTELNMSLYTFSDNNRNGRYDLGDLPLADIVVRLARPDGSSVTTRSNINGFANFSMQFGSDSADIAQAGDSYQFALSVPPRWQLSTGSAVQTVRFEHLPGSVAGLIAVPPPVVVGLAPELVILGSVLPGVAGAVELSALAPSGERLAVEADERGVFTLAVTPGDWQLEASSGADGAVRRWPVEVRSEPVHLAALDPDQAVFEPLPIVVVENFDALQRSVIAKLPGGTSGLDWDFMLAVDNQYYRGPGYVNGLRSGAGVGYNSSGHPVTLEPLPGASAFDFVGAYFAAAWPQAQGETLSVKAWRGGELIAQEEISLSYLGPVWFQADYRSIDKLELASAHYWQFVVDDMVLRLASEPVADSRTRRNYRR